MKTREELLAYIKQLKAEEEAAKTYGDDWKRRDFNARQSQAAGDLCLTVGSLNRAEAKAERSPKSIGGRKAKRKAKRYRRKLKKLEALISERFADYKATTPQYIATPGPSIKLERTPHPATRKDTGPGDYRIE